MHQSPGKLTPYKLLLIVCFITSLIFVQGQQGVAATFSGDGQPNPGEPPVAIPLGNGVKASAANAGCDRPNCIYLPITQSQTASTILDRATSLSLYQSYFLPGNAVAYGWTGNVQNCIPGTTSSAFREAMLKRINYFRLAAGIPALTRLNTTYHTKAQAAALMMSAQDALSHSPDPSWKCYTTDGSEAAGKSNLYLGVSGPAAISGYIRDPGSNNTAAGHRRWILYPQTQEMGTGDIPSGTGYPQANALWVFDSHLWEPRPDTRSPFVSWPPAGYIPYTVVYPRWSFALAGADFSSATVSLITNGVPVGITRYTPAYGYGEPTLVWAINGMGDRDNWPKPGADTVYTVTISGVLVGSQSRNFRYDVIIFDPDS